MLIKCTGILDFNLEDVTNKHKSQSSWKRVAVIKTNCDMDKYYAWFLKKRFNLELNKNLRGSHVTFISDKMDKNLFNEASTVFNGKSVDFFIDIEPRSNAEHWWLRVYCPDVESIREALGLTRDPYFGLHLTIGYANEKNMAHSEYILRQCKKFELISSNPKLPFEDHEVKIY